MNHSEFNWLGAMAGVFLFIILMMFTTVRRAMRLRSRQIDLSDEYQRLTIYAESRLAAQKEQVLAARAETDEAKALHLRQAIDHWRRANRNRKPDDHEAYQDIIAQIAMLEEDLAAMGLTYDEDEA